MAQVLYNLSESLAAAVETAGPAVVRVEARRRLPASGIAWSSDGIVITAHHVVRQDENIGVGLPDGETVPAVLVGRDPTTDLAVLRVQGAELTPPTWAEPVGLRVGHWVLALGRPGRTVQATLGIVSALGGNWRTHAGGLIDRYLQTDVVMYPGFSGGPLVDVAGQVVGLNTSALSRGASLALPIPTLRRVVETLLSHGRVRRGYLGVGTQPVRLPVALAEQLGQETGLLLVHVEPESPAEKGGLLLGDVIVSLEGQPIHHHDNLIASLTSDRVGQATLIGIVRAGQIQEMTVVVGEHL